MRARNLKPGFFKNDDLAACQPLSRLAFAGLWCLADRNGRLEYKPRRIKAEVLPYDNCDIDSILAELAKHGFILVYVAGDGRKCIQIPGFETHQHPHVNEPASELPAPEQHQICTVQAPESSGAKTSDSLLLITDSLLRNQETHTPCQGELGTVPTTPGTAEVPSANSPTAKSYPGSFEQFWNAYPNRGGRKRGKVKAFTLWKSIPVSDRERLLQATANYAHSGEVSRGYARDPERFLRGNWWRDFLEAAFESASRVPTDEDLANWNPVDGGLGHG